MAIAVAPSQHWEGLDGAWSTFGLQVESPPQSSTSFARVECDNQDFCALPLESEAGIGYGGNAIVGTETLTLGYPGSGAPTLKNQVVAGFVVEQPSLGVLGLAPRPVNVSNINDNHDSVLGALRNTSTVASTYFGYTAGAPYRSPHRQYFGSLTFGGYDSERGNIDQVLTVPLSSDTDRELLVALSNISISRPGDTAVISALTPPIYSYTNSLVPEIWLPQSACEVFETAFGLEWDSVLNAYLVNETQHSSLVAQDASVNFMLQRTIGIEDDAQSITISLPYAGFDLTTMLSRYGVASNESSRHFPLRRAQNETQYTLGRVFMQEAYLAVDYDRSKFYISPATFPMEPALTKIVTIHPPGRRSLSTASLIDIIVAVLIVLVGVLGLGCWRWKQVRNARRQREHDDKILAADEEMRKQHMWEQSKFKPELDAAATAIGRLLGVRQELDVGSASLCTPAKKPASIDFRELDGENARHEAPSSRKPVELDGRAKLPELP